MNKIISKLIYSRFFTGFLAALLLCPLAFACPVAASMEGFLVEEVFLYEYSTGKSVQDKAVYEKLQVRVYEDGQLLATIKPDSVSSYGPDNEYRASFGVGSDIAGLSFMPILKSGKTYELELVTPDGYTADLVKAKGERAATNSYKVVNNRVSFVFDSLVKESVDEGSGYITSTYYYRRSSDPIPTPTPTAAPVPTESPAAQKSTTQIIVNQTSLTRTAGAAAFKLNVSVKNGSGSIKYKSSNSSVVSVNTKGVVKVNKPGKATITISVPQSAKYTGASKKITIRVLPKTAASVQASVNNKKKTAKITWKKDTTVSGYQVVAARDKSFKNSCKIYTVTSAKTAAKTITGLKKGKYYVKIRAYKKVSGETLYGKYSTVKVFSVK